MPSFFVGTIPVDGNLVLAPMDGFTDWPFRVLCRELGSAISYTEFVNVDEISFTRHLDSAGWKKLKFSAQERPVAFQLYGNVEPRIIDTAVRLQDHGPDIIDINLGCSIRKIAERGAGAGMLKNPIAIGRLFNGLSKALRIPVTAKIRLGWDDTSRNYLEVARALEENGCRLIAVHARTKEQAFTGQADWNAIAEIKAATKIPILGNGNVRTIEDIDAMFRQTNSDGVMIGRAAIGHPWIFSRREKEDVPLGECIAMAGRHLDLMIEQYGERMGCMIFRKHAVKYIHHITSVGSLRARLVLCCNRGEYLDLFEEIKQLESRGDQETASDKAAPYPEEF